MSDTLNLLNQFADGLARQFGPDCEIVIPLCTLSTEILPTGG